VTSVCDVRYVYTKSMMLVPERREMAREDSLWHVFEKSGQEELRALLTMFSREAGFRTTTHFDGVTIPHERSRGCVKLGQAPSCLGNPPWPSSLRFHTHLDVCFRR
jgi:hypothetical protein